MERRHVSVRYTEFIAENVQQARKVMGDAGLDYDELVATPESEWDELPVHHRKFMQIRKAIGPNNELLGVYAMVMCEKGINAFSDLGFGEEDAVRDNLDDIHHELTLLKDTLPEFKGGANMGPLLRLKTYDELVRLLEKLKSRHYPVEYEMMCKMPDRVRLQAWRSIYRGSKFLPPFDQPEMKAETLKILTSIHEGDFQSRMALLASSPGRIGPYDFIRAIRELSVKPVDQASYPKFIGVYGPKDMDRYISDIIELQKSTVPPYRFSDTYLRILGDSTKYDWSRNGPQNDQVMLMLPLKVWTNTRGVGITPEDKLHGMLFDTSIDNLPEVVKNKNGKKNLHMKTDILQLGKSKTLFKVMSFVVHHDDLTGFIERMKSRIVGPWKPVLNKKISRYKVSRVMAQKDDED